MQHVREVVSDGCLDGVRPIGGVVVDGGSLLVKLERPLLGLLEVQHVLAVRLYLVVGGGNALHFICRVSASDLEANHPSAHALVPAIAELQGRAEASVIRLRAYR